MTETTYRMLVLGNIKGAEKIKNDFKISEKRYWWLRLRYAQKFLYLFIYIYIYIYFSHKLTCPLQSNC